MANERNVDALRTVLAAISEALLPGVVGLMDWYAKQLVSRGVLVPSALTVTEIDWIRWRTADKTQESLEKIAKGDA